MGKCLDILLLVLIFYVQLSVTLSEEKPGSSGRKAAKCQNPVGSLGQIIKKDCTEMFCSKVGRATVWQETFDSSACCSFQRFGFKIGENISTTMQDGSEVNMMCVRRYDGQADIVIKLDDGISGLINKTVATTVDELKQAVTILNASLSSIKVDMAQMKQIDITLNASLSSLKEDMAQMKQTDTALNASVSSLKEDIAPMKQSDTTLNASLSSLKEDMAQMKQTDTTLNVAISSLKEDMFQMKQSDTTLNTSLSSLKEDLTEMKQTDTALTASVSTLKVDMAQTKQTDTTLNASVSSLKVDMAQMKQTDTTLHTSLSSLKVDMAQMKQADTTLKSSLSSLKSNLAQYNQNLQNLPGKWSPGSYCIFASGSCPTGFTRHEGRVRAISTYAATSTYIKAANFGDSKIRCHGTCGQYGHWSGDIYIITCCK